MKKLTLYLLLFIPILSFGHGGEDHGDAAKPAALTGQKYFSSETATAIYEVLIKWGEVQPGKPGVFTLFLTNVLNNAPVDSADIKISVSELSNVSFVAKRTGKGVYQFSGTFPSATAYSFFVNVASILGPDLMEVDKIEIGKKLTPVAAAPTDPWYKKGWVYATLGLLGGLLLMYLLTRSKRRRVATLTLILFCLVPTATYNLAAAHGGEDHGAASPSASGNTSTTFKVEKESQFLFNILTQKLSLGDLYQSVELFGTVTAAPQGRAVIQTPQTGKITALRVTPGQTVGKGQVLAIIEQQVDAGTQINIISQRNTLEAEYVAAKAQYERLLKIADIAAKRDITEAKARYETAARNRNLFQANVGRGSGSTKLISLTSPINGVVGTFNYAIGAVVNSGETLFEVTNLNNLYVEAQVFDYAAAKDASRFTVAPVNDTTSFALQLLSTAQAVNTENQSQRAVFQIVNPGARFKIGENVTVRMYSTKRVRQVVVPNDAITDINGKPAVFIKDRAEQFTVSFVSKGESNEKVTAITKGVEMGESIVTTNVYQMKMIYLNQ